LNTSVATVRMMASSSTIEAVYGSNSDTQAPDCPCCLNFRRLARSLGRSLVKLDMKAKRLFWMNDSGMGCPWSFCRTGLWSNSSSWLGPPAMKR
jgi:hypothetical protein